VSADGVGVVAHAGSVGLRLLADRTGLTGELSRALTRRSFVPVHDRGRVLVEVAVMLADGGEAIADIDVLRHQAGVLGKVASAPTVWRIGRDHARAVEADRCCACPGPPARLVPTPRRGPAQQGRRHGPHFDGGARRGRHNRDRAQREGERLGHVQEDLGFHPLGVWCDNTSEFLTAQLRTGKAGSNTAVDHITVLTHAIAQIPAVHRRDLLIRADGAGPPTSSWTGSPNRARCGAAGWSTASGSRSPRRSARPSTRPEEGLDPGHRRRWWGP
jgi:hypothetical protein